MVGTGTETTGFSLPFMKSRYVSYIPDKEQLIAQVEAVLNEWHQK